RKAKAPARAGRLLQRTGRPGAGVRPAFGRARGVVMSGLSREQMLAVMAYADGELEGPALAEVEALVSSNAQARELARAIEALGDGIRQASVRSIDVADAVMARVVPNDLDRARMRRAARMRVAVVGAALAALAAGVLFYVRSEPPPPVVQTPPSADSVAWLGG